MFWFECSFAVIVTVPAVKSVTLPFASTVATSSLLDTKSTILSVAFAGSSVTVSFTVSPVFASVLSAVSFNPAVAVGVKSVTVTVSLCANRPEP